VGSVELRGSVSVALMEPLELADVEGPYTLPLALHVPAGGPLTLLTGRLMKAPGGTRCVAGAGSFVG